MTTHNTSRDNAIRAAYRAALESAITTTIKRRALQHANDIVCDAISDPDFIVMVESHEYCAAPVLPSPEPMRTCIVCWGQGDHLRWCTREYREGPTGIPTASPGE